MAGTRSNLASPAALQAAGLEEFAALAVLLAEAGPDESVHGARRRIKRLRSLARLLRAALGEDSYADLNAALRRAADALAGQRRAEALAVAAKRLETPGRASGFWRPLAEAHQLDHAQTGDPAQRLVEARAAIARAEAILSKAPLAAAGGNMVARPMVKTYGKARKRLRRALASGKAEELHEARKFVIHHLHHLSFLGGGKKRLAQLEDLRQLLGDLNDLEELEQLAARRSAPLPEKAAARLSKVRARLLGACAAASRRLFRHSPKAYGRKLGVTPPSPDDSG